MCFWKRCSVVDWLTRNCRRLSSNLGWVKDNTDPFHFRIGFVNHKNIKQCVFFLTSFLPKKMQNPFWFACYIHLWRCYFFFSRRFPRLFNVNVIHLFCSGISYVFFTGRQCKSREKKKTKFDLRSPRALWSSFPFSKWAGVQAKLTVDLSSPCSATVA